MVLGKIYSLCVIKESITISRTDYENLLETIARLEAKVLELEDLLSKYERPNKNSSNSSIAPSQDPHRKTKSLRVKSDRPMGGQKGHKGSRLEQVEIPDEIIEYEKTACECCGERLSEEGISYRTAQVFDIPPIKMQVTEHRAIRKTCQNCGTENKASLPVELVQKAQYGNHLKALCVYMQNYQMLPYDRCAEFIEDLTGHHISRGSLTNFIRKCDENLDGFTERLYALLWDSQVVHVDETSVNINGINHWIHVASTHLCSLFRCHRKRGHEAIDDIGFIPEYRGILVHDRWASYFKYTCEHSLCNAHVLRELKFIEESTDKEWAKEMSNLLTQAYYITKENSEVLSPKYLLEVSAKFDSILEPTIKGYDNKFKKTVEERLAFALQKHKDLFLKFLYNPMVPFDNNQAERDLRMMKVKQKVSGLFKSEELAHAFMSTRSYISTLRKNNQKVLVSIYNALNGNPFMPNMAE
jgi:transposase